MHTVSPSEKLGRAPPSRRMSPPSKPAFSSSARLGTAQGWRVRPPRRGTSARKNAPWLFNSASAIKRKSAHLTGSSASAVHRSFGTYPTSIGHSEEQSSYFPPSIALAEKIISSGPEAANRSTDHVDNNKHPAAAAFLTRHMGGHRRRHLHRSRGRRDLPARPLVIHVTRDHRRRTTPVAAAPLHRPAARPRAALC